MDPVTVAVQVVGVPTAALPGRQVTDVPLGPGLTAIVVESWLGGSLASPE
jgi:hypothetical protein